MAKHSGILKELSGKVHNVVGSNWNGIQYVRGVSGIKRKRSGTPRQEIQRARFGLATSFFRPFNSFIPLTFEPVAGQSARNVAMSNIVNNAVTGVYPDFTIDYGKVLVAQGKLETPKNATVSSPEPGKLVFTWDHNLVAHKDFASNNAILVAYEPVDGTVIQTLFGGVRQTGTGMLSVDYFSGKDVHVWMAFRTELENSVSRSVYLGVITVS